MTNETKLVKEVFKDYESRGSILECQILNVSIFKKSNKLVIDLKSNTKIQFGERLEFEYYLKSKFRVQDVQINIEEDIPKKQTKSSKNGEKQEEVSEIIIGSKRSKIGDKPIKVKDVNMDSGKVVICGKIIKQELKPLKTGKFLIMINVFDRIINNYM